jgi:uncharacterized protein (TIGR00369 family)
MSKMTSDEMNRLFKSAFASRPKPWPEIIEVREDYVKIELDIGAMNLRPGGFINGPTQMAIADQVAYAVIFTRLGPLQMAMTSNLNIDFLRPCQGTKLIAEGEMIKLGRSLALISVSLRGNQNEKLSSRATVTYALPK